MGTQNIVNTNMLFLKTFSATSKTKDRQENSISFKDVFKKASDIAKNTDKKSNGLQKNVEESYRAAIVTSKRQVQNENQNLHVDTPFSKELPDGTNSDLENRAEIQSLQAQMMEFLQLIFNLLQSGESLDKFNLDKLFQNSSIQGTDFLNLQLQSLKMEGDLDQYLNLNINQSNKTTITKILHNILQKMVKDTQNQQVQNFIYVQGSEVNQENIFELLKKVLLEKEGEKQIFDVKSDDNSWVKSFINFFAQEDQSFKVLSEASGGKEILNNVLNELENIAKRLNGQKIVDSFNMESPERVQIAEKENSNFNGIGSNDGDFNKVFSTLLKKDEGSSINDQKGEVKTLDLRQHAFAFQNKVENIENTTPSQNDRIMKDLRMSIINQLAEKISVVSRQNLTTLQVSIKPEWLGSVVIELSKDSSGKIFGNFIVTTPHVKEIIEGSLNSLLTILKDQGINISQLNVSLGGNFTGQQNQEQQRFSQRRNLIVQGNEESIRSIESLIYEINESILNLKA
ncbi:Flagellar hook-length control protein-like, C-terminal domain [Caldicellulosiruptor kronotskyensis 2002]|uniref:Flagellar hook-length control protein-like, C-terminal domain n=1 Tax=Caldicellulosiruptor kronotskyensis (strain DSM 18902 / VKM B-2412 / 2002) TaxID=632348 RepID=E4SE81_CALK2|nr:flagellar hook-length control protein FliK [Caldicellulosiruptor kronotskyensis]ADQ45368.1 Flagellar hook-length control protein-like, C-terminal domain [Caldicellulosiruptor kronotskyensis 2002]